MIQLMNHLQASQLEDGMKGPEPLILLGTERAGGRLGPGGIGGERLVIVLDLPAGVREVSDTFALARPLPAPQPQPTAAALLVGNDPADPKD